MIHINKTEVIDNRNVRCYSKNGFQNLSTVLRYIVRNKEKISVLTKVVKRDAEIRTSFGLSKDEFKKLKFLIKTGKFD